VLRPELLVIARTLLSADTETLSLDDVGAALGSLRVTPAEIELLIDWLEAKGRPIAEPEGPPATVLLDTVLVAARALRKELGRAPHPGEIAVHSSLPLAAVQRALWFARILQR
jgi:hypothetical protein